MSPRKEDPPFDVRLHWSPPNENGGKAVQQYLLEYKVLEEPWESAKAVKTNETNMMFIQPKDETYIYEIRISASNEFGFGTISEVMRVYFAGTVNDLIQTKLSMHTYFATFVNFTIFSLQSRYTKAKAVEQDTSLLCLQPRLVCSTTVCESLFTLFASLTYAITT